MSVTLRGETRYMGVDLLKEDFISALVKFRSLPPLRFTAGIARGSVLGKKRVEPLPGGCVLFRTCPETPWTVRERPCAKEGRVLRYSGFASRTLLLWLCGCSIWESVLPDMRYYTEVRLESIADSSVKLWVLDSAAGKKANGTLWVIRRE